MLKQLKNNIELEGGEQKWLTDYYIYPNPETVEVAILSPTETFLVFNNEFTTYEDLKMFSKLILKSVDNSVIKKSDNKDDPNEQNILEDEDKKLLMTLDEFYTKFKYGYIVEKNGSKYTYRLYDKEKKLTEYEYNKIENYLKDLKKNYTFEHFTDKKPDNANDLGLYNLIDTEIKKYTIENNTFFETNIETKIKSEIRDSIYMKTLLEYSDQNLATFNEEILNNTNNTLFLSKLSAEVKKNDKPLNMLIKIDINQFNTKENISYIESEANNTNAYLDIQRIINEYMIAKKAKDDSKITSK